MVVDLASYPSHETGMPGAVCYRLTHVKELTEAGRNILVNYAQIPSTIGDSLGWVVRLCRSWLFLRESDQKFQWEDSLLGPSTILRFSSVKPSTFGLPELL